ncbi:MAG: ferritin-like domain-containing protein [Solirubrobacteraceae bacterium]
MDVTEFDRDEAVAEAMTGLQEMTRGTALKRGGLLAGGALAATLLPTSSAFGRIGGSKKQDIEILNFALTLEYLEAEFYALAVKHADQAKFGPRTRYFAQTVASHEATHVQALKAVLGSKAVKKPTFDFKGTTRKTSSFLLTSKVLEDTGVAAYAGQGPRIHQNAVLAPAGAILAVEARHAAWVRRLIGGSGNRVLPAPAAFDAPATMDEILDAVGKTGFIKS